MVCSVALWSRSRRAALASATIAPGTPEHLGDVGSEELVGHGRAFTSSWQDPRNCAAGGAQGVGETADVGHYAAAVLSVRHEEGHHVGHCQRGSAWLEVLERMTPAASLLLAGVLAVLGPPDVKLRLCVRRQGLLDSAHVLHGRRPAEHCRR